MTSNFSHLCFSSLYLTSSFGKTVTIVFAKLNTPPTPVSINLPSNVVEVNMPPVYEIMYSTFQTDNCFSRVNSLNALDCSQCPIFHLFVNNNNWTGKATKLILHMVVESQERG